MVIFYSYVKLPEGKSLHKSYFTRLYGNYSYSEWGLPTNLQLENHLVGSGLPNPKMQGHMTSRYLGKL